MTEDPKPARKRKPPTQLKVSEESVAALKARLNSAEGQQWLNEFASMITEWAARSMPTELLQALGERENLDTLKELWPDIVDAYFKALSNPARGN
jgi:hypothetical protein